MKLDIKSEWLLRHAEKGANGIVSVGGLVSRLEQDEMAPATPTTERAALASFVEFQRRKLRLTIEQLAAKANVEIDDILSIERGQGADDPRTIYNLAAVLKVPAEKLMLLAGLVSKRDPDLEKAAVRFAARSASIESLNKEETEALEEFVRILAK